MKKALSILLIVAAVFGFYGGAVNLKDVLACKDYWEVEGEKSTENLNKLEDGINQLKENEQAYLDGLDKVAQGEQDLAKGEADYAAGQKELAAGEADYAAAPAKLAAGEKKVAAGEAALRAGKKQLDDNKDAIAMVKTLIKGIDQYSEGFSVVDKGFNGLSQIKDAAGKCIGNIDPDKGDGLGALIKEKIDPNNAKGLQTYYGAILQNYNSNEGMKKIAPAIDAITGLEDTIEQLTQIYPYPNAMGDLSALKQAKKILNTNGFSTVYEAVNSGASQVQAGAIQILGGCLNSGNTEIVNALKQGWTYSVYPALKEKLENAIAYVPTDITKLTDADTWGNMPLDVKYGVLNGLNQMFAQLKAELQKKVNEYAAGEKQVKQGEKELAAGKKELAKGYADYKAAPGKLAAGRAQLAAGAAKLAQGRLDLADGKAQLAQYEDGEQQVRDGLATLFATEANGGLESIASRLNNDDNFDNEDGHLMLDRGLTGVQEGRNYSDDSSVVITKELTTRAIGTGAGLGAALLALIGAILCFAKKYKGAGVFAALTAICGVAGIAVAKSAGTEFSGIAGSPLSATPYIAFAVLAGLGVIAAIANFAAKKA